MGERIQNTLRLNLIALFVLLSGKAFAITPADSITYANYSAKQYCFNSTDGILKYRDEGEGVPIVLLHGIPTSGWLFREMITELASNGFRVIVPDMLGFGNSGNPSGNNIYAPKNHARRFLELMEALDINEWVHLAHGAAGLWTVEIIDQAPTKISKLILINTLLDPANANWSEQIGTGVGAKIGLSLQRWGWKKSSFVSDYISKNSEKNEDDTQVLLGYEAPILKGKTKAVFSHYGFMLESFVSEHASFEGFRGEVAVIWGTQDPVLKWDEQKRILPLDLNLKEENIHLLPSGHLIPEDHPTFIDSVITQFVQPR